MLHYSMEQIVGQSPMGKKKRRNTTGILFEIHRSGNYVSRAREYGEVTREATHRRIY